MNATKKLSKKELHKALGLLISVCDGAVANDGRGLNAYDQWMRRYSVIPFSEWTTTDAFKILRAMQKYKNQLKAYGYNLDTLPSPEDIRNSGERWVKVIGGKLVVRVEDFDYHLREQIQSIPGRKFNAFSRGEIPGNTNVFPLASDSVAGVYDFVERNRENYRFTGNKESHDLFEKCRNGVVGNELVEDIPDVGGNVSFDGRNFLLDAEYNIALVEEIREIPGRRWDKDNGINSVPPTVPAVERLVSIANKYFLTIEQPAREKINEVLNQAEFAENASVSSCSSAPYDYKLPDGLELKDYQWAGVEWIAQYPITLVADDMGLGKTITSLVAAGVKNMFPLVVVSPSSVKFNWKREARKWLPGKTVQVLRGRDDVVGQGVDIVVLNYDILIDYAVSIKSECPYTPYLKSLVESGDLSIYAWSTSPQKLRNGKTILEIESTIKNSIEVSGKAYISPDGETIKLDVNCLMCSPYLNDLRTLKPKCVVFDESHYLSNAQSKRSKQADDLVHGSDRVRRGNYMVRKSGQYEIPNVLLLSGTPIVNRPKELIQQLKIMKKLDVFGGWKKFTERYCNATPDYGGSTDISGSSNLEELNNLLRKSGLMLRRKKADVLDQLPAFQWAALPVEITNMSKYREVEMDTSAWYAKRAIEEKEFLESIQDLSAEDQKIAKQHRADDAYVRAQRAESLTKISALRQVSAEGKIEHAKRWVKNAVDSGEKVVVFAHHKPIVKALVKEFNAPYIAGGVSDINRLKVVDKFQEDPECKVIVVNLRAGGEGVTLTAASKALFVEYAWTYARMDQAISRLHRMGQENKVIGYIMAGVDTVDDYMIDVIDGKEEVTSTVIDGAHDNMDIANLVHEKLMEKGMKTL